MTTPRSAPPPARELRIPAASDSAYGSDHAPASDDQRESIRGRPASRIGQTKHNSGLPCFPRCTRISTEQMSAPQCAGNGPLADGLLAGELASGWAKARESAPARPGRGLPSGSV